MSYSLFIPSNEAKRDIMDPRKRAWVQGSNEKSGICPLCEFIKEKEKRCIDIKITVT
jgi:hypothetical protein